MVMEILHGPALGLKLRELSDSAKRRVWIVSPYIGRWPAVSALLGAMVVFRHRPLADHHGHIRPDQC
jgi:hypothetical protein